jgi:catechol 2,3-dioxygenase-like lactoylglutathione lyase family enzyme
VAQQVDPVATSIEATTIFWRSVMLDKINELVTAYDEKRIGRRQLIGALLMASATPLRASQQKPAVNLTGTPPPSNALFRGRIVNHVTLRVKDVEESRRFYQELIGASVLLDARTAEQTGSIDLLLGDSFVTVSGGRGAPDIDHFAIGLDPWPGAERALDMVQKRFPTSEARANQNQFSKAAEVRSVMLKDPSGISVQLGSVKYQL